MFFHRARHTALIACTASFCLLQVEMLIQYTHVYPVLTNVGVVQVDVQARADDARQELRKFSHHIATLLVEASRAHISELDAHLIGVRDGVVSDEAAIKRCKVPRCSSPPC